jgi:hypothetical protein
MRSRSRRRSPERWRAARAGYGHAANAWRRGGCLRSSPRAAPAPAPARRAPC